MGGAHPWIVQEFLRGAVVLNCLSLTLLYSILMAMSHVTDSDHGTFVALRRRLFVVTTQRINTARHRCALCPCRAARSARALRTPRAAAEASATQSPLAFPLDSLHKQYCTVVVNIPRDLRRVPRLATSRRLRNDQSLTRSTPTNFGPY